MPMVFQVARTDYKVSIIITENNTVINVSKTKALHTNEVIIRSHTRHTVDQGRLDQIFQRY
jgi:hypothetical protein